MTHFLKKVDIYGLSRFARSLRFLVSHFMLTAYTCFTRISFPSIEKRYVYGIQHLNEIHIALQGKGGIGKSLICRFLVEYLGAVGYDADPSNRTLAACRSMDVREFELLDSRGSIDPVSIDKLMESAIEETDDVVIDIGASSYVEVFAYWREMDLASVFEASGKTLWMHYVLVGGGGSSSTVTSLADRDETGSKATRACVWENEYFGPLLVDLKMSGLLDGCSHVKLRQHSRLYAAAMEAMILEGRSFEDAIAASRSILNRTRLKQQRDDIWEQLERALDRKTEAVKATL